MGDGYMDLARFCRLNQLQYHLHHAHLLLLLLLPQEKRNESGGKEQETQAAQT